MRRIPEKERRLWPALLALAAFALALPQGVRAGELATNSAAHASNSITRVEIDYSKAPECARFAERSKTLVEEWYPRIRELFGDDGDNPPPVPLIRLVFERKDGVAGTANDVIHISAEWVAVKATNDYGMVIHELTHIVQAYKGGGEGWLTEGIADFIRLNYFEPNAPRPRINPERHSYKDGYKITALFLIWLEKKSPHIVQKLNTASRRGESIAAVFKDATGSDVDTLWRKFAGNKPR